MIMLSEVVHIIHSYSQWEVRVKERVLYSLPLPLEVELQHYLLSPCLLF